MAIHYRTATGRCALCDEEADLHQLQKLIGLPCCKRCLAGDLALALEHWGFVVAEKYIAASRHGTERFFIEVKRPTFVEAFAKFETDTPSSGWLSRLFRQQDPQVGDEAFDEQVLIAPDPGADAATMQLLEHEGVRAGVLELVKQGAIVDLTGHSIWVHDDDTGVFDTFVTMEEARPVAVALAVHIERIARGDTDSTSVTTHAP